MGAFIYAIVDNRTSCAIYVGMATDLKKRLTQHRCRLLSKQEKDYFEIIEIEKVNSRFDFDTESDWIEYFRFMGCELRNKTRYGNTRILTKKAPPIDYQI